MRNRLMIFGAGSLFLAVSGCAIFDSFTKFRLNYDKDFTIPAGVPPNIPYDIPTPYFPTNSQQYFDQNNTNSDLVESCKLEQMYALIDSPPGEDFSFLQSIEVYLTAPGMSEVKVASQNNVPATNDTLFFNVEEVELLDYIRKDSIGLRVKVLTDEEIQDAIHTKVHGTFLLDAKILGV